MECLEPLVATMPLQLLADRVAVCKGTNVDQPRNLAKSVTVEKQNEGSITVALVLLFCKSLSVACFEHSIRTKNCMCALISNPIRENLFQFFILTGL
jgi:hypothetical protein